jgi:polyphosphate kinase
MIEKFPYIERDISWLSFNNRVLQEAKDKRVPLLERLKFLAIYSSNLEEFFRVRVAITRSVIKLGKKSQKALDFKPSNVLRKLRNKIIKQQIEFTAIYETQILPELAENNIFIRKHTELTETQKAFVVAYYQKNKSIFGRPIILSNQIIRPSLQNSTIYLITELKSLIGEEGENFALFSVPTNYLPRFIVLPSENPKHNEVILLDDIVRFSIPNRLPNYESNEAFSIKLTRDAELYIDDEFSGDLVEKIKAGLAKRNVGPAARFVYDRRMPDIFLKFLKDFWNLKEVDLFPEGSIHNNFDFFAFPNFGKSYLENEKLPLLPKRILEESKDIFNQIKVKDEFLHVPYHSYESVCQFFEQAANDENVTEIKIIQYRVAKQSRIMEALIKAAQSGKKVTAFVEIKARFDEESNLIWADRLKNAGVNVLYSFPGLKVHAKLALVTRKEGEQEHKYCYLATGNFHEKTAKIYSDFGIFTYNKKITSEIEAVFNYLEFEEVPKKGFKHLWVGQFNLRENILAKIDNEIENARKGKLAHVLIKVNSMEDKEVVNKLYEANLEGVKIDLIVRGICCIVPGIPGISHNINAISIVDRYLEHARVFKFHNNGKPITYLSSADAMERNLSRRIEVAFPILNKKIEAHIHHFLNIQLQDNVKARLIDKNHKNEYKVDASPISIQSQLETFEYVKQLES